jgi:DNA-directed RNA polymerase subunit RPC12/RpoP
MNRDVACAECQQTVGRENTIQYGDLVICAECKPRFVQRLREGALPAGKEAFAGFWIRCGATIIDQILLSAITFPILIAVYMM